MLKLANLQLQKMSEFDGKVIRGSVLNKTKNNLKIGLRANSASQVHIYVKILLNLIKSAPTSPNVEIRKAKLVQKILEHNYQVVDHFVKRLKTQNLKEN